MRRVSSRKYENRYRTKICNFTVFQRSFEICRYRYSSNDSPAGVSVSDEFEECTNMSTNDKQELQKWKLVKHLPNAPCPQPPSGHELPFQHAWRRKQKHHQMFCYKDNCQIQTISSCNINVPAPWTQLLTKCVCTQQYRMCVCVCTCL